jgi:hypothetical protein
MLKDIPDHNHLHLARSIRFSGLQRAGEGFLTNPFDRIIFFYLVLSASGVAFHQFLSVL